MTIKNGFNINNEIYASPNKKAIKKYLLKFDFIPITSQGFIYYQFINVVYGCFRKYVYFYMNSNVFKLSKIWV